MLCVIDLCVFVIIMYSLTCVAALCYFTLRGFKQSVQLLGELKHFFGANIHMTTNTHINNNNNNNNKDNNNNDNIRIDVINNSRYYQQQQQQQQYDIVVSLLLHYQH